MVTPSSMSRLPGQMTSSISPLGFPDSSVGKESTCDVGDLGQSLDWDDPLETGKATHSSILTWRFPRTV